MLKYYFHYFFRTHRPCFLHPQSIYTIDKNCHFKKKYFQIFWPEFRNFVREGSQKFRNSQICMENAFNHIQNPSTKFESDCWRYRCSRTFFCREMLHWSIFWVHIARFQLHSKGTEYFFEKNKLDQLQEWSLEFPT